MFDSVAEGVFQARFGDWAVGTNGFGHNDPHAVGGEKDVCWGVCAGTLFHPSGVHVVAAVHF